VNSFALKMAFAPLRRWESILRARARARALSEYK